MQVVCTVLSADQENDPRRSRHDWRLGSPYHIRHTLERPHRRCPYRHNGRGLHHQPDTQELVDSKLNLVIAGTRDSIMMVEAASREVTNEQVLKALEIGHEQIKHVIKMIDALKAECGKETIEVPLRLADETLSGFMHEHLYADIAKAMRTIEKKAREADTGQD